MNSRLFLASIAAALLGSSASAATLKVPSAIHPTIASACAAAIPGDLIEIKGGKYAEPIALLLKDGITVRGKGKVVIDAQAFDNGIAVTACTNMQIENVEVRNAAEVGVLLSSCGNVRLKKVRSIGSQLDGFESIDGIGHWLLNCVAIDSGGSGFAIEADQSCIRQCGVFGAVQIGIRIDGAGNLVAQCKIKSVGQRGIHFRDGGFNCDANVITDNVITDIDGVGIYADSQGEGNVVRRNKVKNCLAQGMVIQLDGIVIADNRVSVTESSGIWLSCARASILGNKVTNAGLNGFLFVDSSDNSTVIGNSVKGAGNFGFEVHSNPLTLAKNTAKGCVNGPVTLGANANVMAFENGFAVP